MQRYKKILHLWFFKTKKVCKRTEAIYREDAGKPIRKSHENPSIKKIYEEYFGEPCSHKSHELLHTHYFDKSEHVEISED